MSFELLKQVVSLLRQKARCTHCKSRFNEDLVFVLSTTVQPDTAAGLGLFFIVCEKCSNTGFALVEVMPHNEKLEFCDIREISLNEVLDMHNFLKEWKGDVKELF